MTGRPLSRFNRGQTVGTTTELCPPRREPFPEMNAVADVIADFRHSTELPYGRPGQLREAPIEWDERLALLSKPQELRKQFSPPPSKGNYGDQFVFALSSEWHNTVPLHVEWHGKSVQGVIQPVSIVGC